MLSIRNSYLFYSMLTMLLTIQCMQPAYSCTLQEASNTENINAGVITYSPDRNTLAVALSDPNNTNNTNIQLYRTNNNGELEAVGSSTSITGQVFSASFAQTSSTSGTYLAIGYVHTDTTPYVRLLEVQNDLSIALIAEQVASGTVVSIAFSPNNNCLAATSGFAVNFYTIPDLIQSSTLTSPDILSTAQFSPDGNYIYVAISTATDNIAVYDRIGCAHGTLLNTYTSGTFPVALDISPDDNYLAAANIGSNDVSLFEIAGNMLTKSMGPDNNGNWATGQDPQSVQFSPDGACLAVGNTTDESLTIFNYANGLLTDPQVINDIGPAIGQGAITYINAPYFAYSSDGSIKVFTRQTPPTDTVVNDVTYVNAPVIPILNISGITTPNNTVVTRKTTTILNTSQADENGNFNSPVSISPNSIVVGDNIVFVNQEEININYVEVTGCENTSSQGNSCLGSTQFLPINATNTGTIAGSGSPGVSYVISVSNQESVTTARNILTNSNEIILAQVTTDNQGSFLTPITIPQDQLFNDPVIQVRLTNLPSGPIPTFSVSNTLRVINENMLRQSLLVQTIIQKYCNT